MCKSRRVEYIIVAGKVIVFMVGLLLLLIHNVNND